MEGEVIDKGGRKREGIWTGRRKEVEFPTSSVLL